MNRILSVLIIVLIMFSSESHAVASLVSEDVINDIVATNQFGEKKIYTVYRDNEDKTKWLYLPIEISLASYTDKKGKLKPKMTLLRYMRIDPITKESTNGGIISATFTYGMDAVASEEVKAAIRAHTHQKNITLAAIPLRKSDVSWLTDSGKFVANPEKASFAGATSASQEMVVTLDLSELGASVIGALAKSGGGLTMRARVEYNAMSPPCGYHITGNLSAVKSYYEKKSKKEGGVNFWFIKAGGSSSKDEINEMQSSSENITAKRVECQQNENGKNNTNNADEALMQGALKKIEAKVFDSKFIKQVTEMESLQSMLSNTNDEKLKKRLVDLMTEGKKALQLGYQKSIKSRNQKETEVIDYNFTRRKLLVKSTTFGSGIGFEKFGMTEEELIKEGFIIDLDAGAEFPSVIFGLPDISEQFKLRGVDLEVTYTNSDGKSRSEVRRWKQGVGWSTLSGAKHGFIRFNLIGESNESRIKSPEFDVKLVVVADNNASFSINRKLKFGIGDRLLGALESLTTEYSFDASDIDFYKISNNTSDMLRVSIELQKGDIKSSFHLRPYFVSGEAVPPRPAFILLPSGGDDMSATVTYKSKDKKVTSEEVNIIAGENIFDAPSW